MTPPDRMSATRASYDAVAGAYAEALSDELRHKPLDRALLTAFAEQVRELDLLEPPRVWDVGCGPGHVTAFLAGLGLNAAGIDLSDGMVAEARKRHQGLEFSTGSMTALPAADGAKDGLVSFYSLIHMIDDADLRAALAEYRRVLADGGLLLLAVHAGQEVRHSAEWFGARVDVSFRFFDPVWLDAELERAGFSIESLTTRQPYPEVEVATTRAYFLARACRYLRPGNDDHHHRREHEAEQLIAGNHRITPKPAARGLPHATRPPNARRAGAGSG